MKHTPGPWAVGVYNVTDAFRSIAQHACVCDPETLALIAVTGRAGDRQSQVDADLITAAPDLLAALRALCDTLTQLDPAWDADDEVKAARAAIRKAEKGA